MQKISVGAQGVYRIFIFLSMFIYWLGIGAQWSGALFLHFDQNGNTLLYIKIAAASSFYTLLAAMALRGALGLVYCKGSAFVWEFHGSFPFL